jgi:uncharacterized membrane protein
MSSFPWRTLTIVSLAINLLIIGAAVGLSVSHFSHGGPPRFFERREAGEHGPQAMRMLPQAEREALSRALIGAWESGHDLLSKARAARENVRSVAAADPYDETAVRKALADMRTADSAVLAHYQDALAGSLGKLSSEQRLIALRAATRPGAGGPRELRALRMRHGDGPPGGMGPPSGMPPPR